MRASNVTAGSEPLPCGGHLHTDATGTHDCQSGRHGGTVRGLPIGPRLSLTDPGDIRKGRTTTGTHGDGVPGRQHRLGAVRRRDGDAPGPCQTGVATDHLHADRCHGLGLSGVIPVGGVSVSATENPRWSDVPLDRFPRAVDAPGIGYRDHRSQ